MPSFKHFEATDQARSFITRIVAQRRAELFLRPQPGDSTVHPDDDEVIATRVDYLLHSLHATLSAQRALFTCFELMRSSVRLEVGCELGDAALEYIAHLAAHPPQGSIDLVTYEHVAELLAAKVSPGGGA